MTALLITLERNGLIIEQQDVPDDEWSSVTAADMLHRWMPLQAGDKLTVERDEGAPPIIPRQEGD